MPATPIQVSLFNATINPYEGKRPKVVNKLYSIKDMFERISRLSFPIELRTNNTLLNYISITSVLACLPGGRGCIGKERLGTKLTNRQIALVNNKGVKYNPKFKDSKYGFLQMVGTLVFKDGSTSNISIPVETSGVVGIRAGASQAIKMTQNNAQNKLMQLLLAIEKPVLKLTGITKKREPKLEMLNAYFNLYTDKTGKNRPKVVNFKKFLKALYKNGLNKEYSMTRMSWLMTQGNPTVTKGVFKPLPNSTFATITVSPFGRVEVLGVKSFDVLRKIYKMMTTIYTGLPDETTQTYLLTNNDESRTKRKYVKKTKSFNVSILDKLLLKKQGKTLLINNKECQKYEKTLLVELAKKLKISHRGTRKTLCNNILDTI